MKAKSFLRVFLLVLIASISVFLFSWSHKTTDSSESNNCESGKCSEKKSQSEFILWESLTRNLLSASR